MIFLIKQIKSLEKSRVNEIIEQRLKEFSNFQNYSNEAWFSELCFCILAANSKQKTSEFIQKQLGNKLLTISEKELALFIKDSKHRFHNNKAKYIVEARKHYNIKEVIKKQKDEFTAREWLVKNVKGLGYKEASHFLRNFGLAQNLAILDRHVMSIMAKHKLISKPKTLTKNNYLDIEKRFIKLASKLGMPSAKLDLFLWYLEKGEVSK